MVGIGGYGEQLLYYLRRFVPADTYELVCAADPFFKSSPASAALKTQGISIYEDPEEMYLHHEIDLTVIASPIHRHRDHVLSALQNQSHALCEKPLVPTVQDANEIAAEMKRSGKKLGVGFQWSFSPTMRSLKRDILAGNLGQPLSLRTSIPWKRFDKYYRSDWKGKIADQSGAWILDSIVTNAAAHYLHNMLFLLGETEDTAALPEKLFSEIYRQKDIDSFDTCFLKGSFSNGCSLFFGASHSPDIQDEPVLRYSFEEGTVYMNRYDRSSRVVLHRRDGRVVEYGNPQSDEECGAKLRVMVNAITHEEPIPCTLNTVMPHLRICNAIFAESPIFPFESARILSGSGSSSGSFVFGLFDEMQRCFEECALPGEMGFSWAKEPTRIHPEKMEVFTGLFPMTNCVNRWSDRKSDGRGV